MGISVLEYCFGAFLAVTSDREIFQFGTAGMEHGYSSELSGPEAVTTLLHVSVDPSFSSV